MYTPNNKHVQNMRVDINFTSATEVAGFRKLSVDRLRTSTTTVINQCSSENSIKGMPCRVG